MLVTNRFERQLLTQKGLQTVIKSDGVWRIRKRERVPKIEVVKLEDTGHGDIISEAFLQWRTVELPAMQDGGMPSQGK